MNEQQAIEQCEALNLLIEEYLQFIRFYVYQYWDLQYNKIYKTILLPTKYTDSYNEASDSIKIAFVRVGIKSILESYETAEDIVNNFDNLVITDPELNKYIGKNDYEVKF